MTNNDKIIESFEKACFKFACNPIIENHAELVAIEEEIINALKEKDKEAVKAVEIVAENKDKALKKVVEGIPIEDMPYKEVRIEILEEIKKYPNAQESHKRVGRQIAEALDKLAEIQAYKESIIKKLT